MGGFFLTMVYKMGYQQRGMGLFITLVLVLLVVLGIMGYYNHKFVGRISRDVAMTTLGDHAVFLAETAIEEAQFLFNKDLNEPNTQTFQALRAEAITRETISLRFEVPEFQKILEGYPFMDYQLKDGHVLVDVIFQKAFSTMPYEKKGTLRFKAEITASAGFGKQFRRIVEDYKEFRSALVAPPRPYDQTTFYVQNIEGWINPSNENQNITNSNKDIDVTIPKIRQGWKDYFEKFREFDDYIDVDRYKAMLDQPPLDPQKPNLISFPTQMVAYSKLGRIDDLKRLDLPGRIQLINEEIRIQRESLLRADKELDRHIRQALDRRDQNYAESNIPPAIESVALETKKLSDLHVKRLNIYADFQSLIILLSGNIGTRVGSFFGKYNSLEEWRQKALHIIGEDADVNQSFEELIKRYQPLNGVVFVDNPSQTLKITGKQFKGKVFVVTKGNLELSDIEPVDESNDLVSFLSYGNTTLNSRITASISAMGELRMNGQPMVKGNIILNRVFRPEQLRGILDRDPRLYSGKSSGGGDSKLHYVYIGVGPRSIAHHLDRTPIGF